MSASIRVSVQESVANKLVRSGGDTEAILTAAEREYLVNPPRNPVEAFDLLDRAAKSVDPGYAGGSPVDLQPILPDQEKLLLNNGGVKTLLKINGEIIVTDAKGNVLQHLVPP